MDENMNLTPENNDDLESTPEIVNAAEPEPVAPSDIEVVSEGETVPEPEIVPAQPEPIVGAPQNTSGGNTGAANQTTPPPQNVTYVQNIVQKPEEGSTVLAVVSLVLGILGILTSCCLSCMGIPACLIFSIPATVCSIISIVKKQGGRGMAIAGLVMGILGDISGLISLLMLVGMFGSMMSLSDMQDYMA